METITLVSSGLPILLPQVDRTLGVVHVSSTIRDMCLRLGTLYQDEQSDTSIDQTLMRLGSTFEWALIQRYQLEYPNRYIVPPERSLDGIYGHPDLLDNKNELVKEIKFTYRSSGKVPCGIGEHPIPDHPILSPKFYKDRLQLKSYCRMEELTRGELEICHLKGDYLKDDNGNYQFKVVHNIWGFEFTKQGLIEHWDRIRRHAEEYACGVCNRFEFEGHEGWCIYRKVI